MPYGTHPTFISIDLASNFGHLHSMSDLVYTKMSSNMTESSLRWVV